MSVFTRPLPSVRLAETHHGDTPQDIAFRELGDANRWPELVWINKLVPPYITDNPDEAGERVLLTGSLIKIPAPLGTPVASNKRAEVFGRDCGLWGKRLLATEAGDFAVVAGTKNLTQQIRHAINTPRGQQTRHPRYGCMVWVLHGKITGPTADALGAEYVRSTLDADYRIREVISSEAETVGDALRVVAVAETIDGGVVDITNEPPTLDGSHDEADDNIFILTTNLLHEFVHVTLPEQVT